MRNIIIERNYPADGYSVRVQSDNGLELLGVVPSIEAGRRMLVEKGLRDEQNMNVHSIHDIRRS